MNQQVKQIGNYTYNERFCLGEGSFGKVYEGSAKNGKRVAIKKVDKKLINSDQYLREAIETQITILKKFNHPNIVKLDDVVLTANSIYVITELCRNGDLKSYIRTKKPSEGESIKILVQLINGMREIVKQGIIHRDLKPANILVHDGVFKICDFGFAKYFKEIGKMNRTCVGTPMYMSPQALKHKPYTNKSDVWSLGVVFYEMLFNKTPWQGNAEDELYRNITTKPLFVPNCSKWCSTILRCMLEVEESNRWGWDKVFQFVERPGDFAQMAEKPSLFYQQESGPSNGFQFNQLKLVKKGSQQDHPISSSPARQPPPSQRQPLANVQPKPYTEESSIPASDVRLPPWQQNYFVPEQAKTDQSVSRTRNSIFPKAELKMKPKNMLAYFQQDKTSEDPRFCYFILVELYLNPLRAPSFQQFLSSLSQHTIQCYNLAIQQQKPSPYRQLLQWQIQQVRDIEIKRVQNRQSTRQLAQMVYNESDKISNMSKEWVKRFIDRKYGYDPI